MTAKFGSASIERMSTESEFLLGYISDCTTASVFGKGRKFGMFLDHGSGACNKKFS